MRRGEYEVNASIEGFGGNFDSDTFEEEFYLLGTTPLEYEFNLVLNLVPSMGDAEGDSGGREAGDEEHRRGERN